MLLNYLWKKMTIDVTKIAGKWQKEWNEKKVYETKEWWNKPKFYILDMFPYPSGAGLHVGHPKGYIASDTIARKKLLEGYNVLHPMGFDTFGLWTEQYAIDHKMKPQVVAKQNIDTYIKQLENIGFTYDWERSFSTADPEYYKWTQSIFLKFYNHYYDEAAKTAKPIEELEQALKAQWKSDEEIKKIVDNERLAYIDYKPINWCPHCKTGLANEDLDDGKCERCGSPVEQKPMKQWVLRITKYAERLLDGLENLDWDESMKELERNWIWKSSGTQFRMNIKDSEDFFEVYTTRVDTVFWMTFVVMAPEHPLVDKITTPEQRNAVNTYKEQAKYKTQLERTELQKEKTGQFTWAYAINPFNGKEVPIYIWDYVLANYGTWVVMAVPAHDERDFDFAKKHNIPIIQSIMSEKTKEHYDFDALPVLPEIATEKGILIDSWEFTGLKSEEAITKMQQWLKTQNMWSEKINYKIQDWVFSRQRYWGEPFPVVFCPDHWTVPLKDSDLPLTLPDVEHYEPTGTEEGPLAEVYDWINTTCPICWKPAKRESNTMPGWAGSSWYWLRYMDPHNHDEMLSKERDEYWRNVDVYIWGAEHVTRHMIYARFWQNFLYDLWLVCEKEPFKKYQKVGLIMAEDWRKMSKRWGNVVNPDDIIEEYWADVFRTYEMFMGPFDQFISWNTNGIKWVKKFIDKVVALWDKVDLNLQEEDKNINILLHQTIKKLTQEIDDFKFNTSISQLMILVNALTEREKIAKPTFEALTLLMAPFAPHLAEEFWSLLGNEFSIFTTGKWPKYDEKFLVASEVTLAVQFNWKMRWTLQIAADATQEDAIQAIKSDAKLSNYYQGEPKKIIFIPWKIINIIL